MVHLADLGTVRVLPGPVLGQPLFVEGKDALVRREDGLLVGRREALGGGGELLGLHDKVARGEFGTVEFGRVVGDGRVATLPHIREDGGDRIGHLLRGGCRAAEGREFVGEVFGGSTDDTHTRA